MKGGNWFNCNQCYVSVSYYASVFSVEKFGRLDVVDEYVELCDLLSLF